MVRLNNKIYSCPVDVALSFIGGKWKILILSHLKNNQNRGFAELKSIYPRLSEKMLAQQLKELERDELIIKNTVSVKPLRVQYNLSERGLTLSPLFKYLSKFGLDYLKRNNIDYVKEQKTQNAINNKLKKRP
ncbi:MAG: transcriptional regulator [Chitinophagaceae bacterium]|nr:MAG: transcriptional regulator [Chitinophagaceae bacterium]